MFGLRYKKKSKPLILLVMSISLNGGCYDTNSVSPSVRDSLHYAVIEGDMEKVLSFVSSDRQYLVCPLDSAGDTLLHIAVMEKGGELTEQLLQLGADVNTRNKIGKTPLHIVCEDRQFNIEDKLRLIIEDSESLNTKGKNVLSWSEPSPEPFFEKEKIADLLLDNGAKADTLDIIGRTPLSYAAQNGFMDIVESIVRKRPIESQRRLGFFDISFPIHHASAANHENVVRFLAQHGWSLHEPDSTGNTPLHAAAEKGHSNILKYLLLEGVDPNIRSHDNETALHAAVNSTILESVKLLIDAGVDTDVKNRHGLTAYDVAISLKNERIAELLSSVHN